MEKGQMIAIDTQALQWEERFNEKLGRALYRKNLVTDPDTGMEIRLVRYPAGVINVRHTHPCAHGMYVIEGTLVTHAGQFGPGSFVWFPEGHGDGTRSHRRTRRDRPLHHQQALRDSLPVTRDREGRDSVTRSDWAMSPGERQTTRRIPAG